jgi:NAD(P)-dependent dehydrogenase (short-subunit alcohol dehydrogenase family)
MTAAWIGFAGGVLATLVSAFVALRQSVNGVCPGPTRTTWWTDEGGAADIIAAQAGTDRESVMATVAPETMQITTGRLVDPQEIADAVVLLASPRSASTIGAEIVVDGGFVKGF